MSRAFVTLVVAFLVLSTSATAQLGSLANAEAIRIAIDRALGVAPRGFEALLVPSQTGVRVQRVDVSRTSATAQRITIDLSQKALTYDPDGDVDAILDHVLRSTAPLINGTDQIDFRILVDGIPLEQFMQQPQPPTLMRPMELGKGGKVVVSPGHGWYWDETTASWRLQRDYYWGIVEDFVNWEFASYVEDALRASGLDVRPVRYPARDETMGGSGQPAWQESAKYFIKALGAPAEVSDYGTNNYNRDINSRPFYANWIDSAVMISIHNNGGGGTGTETWYDETNGYAEQSRRLAQIVNDHVVAAIRADYNPNWPNRGLRSCNACKGENRLALRPAIILEVAFMDTKSPDNDALHNDAFKRIVAQAVRQAVQEFAQLQ
jgi:N-acetylmuramoyl-L-alanine amidase